MLFSRTSCKFTYESRIRYFDKEEGRESGLVAEALLSTGYLGSFFGGGSKDGINPFVFQMAILLEKGERLALEHLYLNLLYAILDECVNGIISSVGRYDVMTTRIPISYNFPVEIHDICS